MKKIKKILSVILCVLMVFTVCVPAFAEKASPEREEESRTEQSAVTEEEPVIPDEDPDGEGEENETPENVIPEDGMQEEDTYIESLRHCLNEGVRNLGLGALFMVGSVCSPVLFMVFPPIGASLFFAGLPFGAVCFVTGAGEIITSPVLALFFDTDDNLSLI